MSEWYDDSVRPSLPAQLGGLTTIDISNGHGHDGGTAGARQSMAE